MLHIGDEALDGEGALALGLQVIPEGWQIVAHETRNIVRNHGGKTSDFLAQLYPEGGFGARDHLLSCEEMVASLVSMTKQPLAVL